MTEHEQEEYCAPEAGPVERLRCIETIVEALGFAYTVEEVADVIIGRGLSSLGGSAASIALLSTDASEFVTIRCNGFPPDVVEKYRRYPYDTHIPNADVVRSGKSLYIESHEERNRAYPEMRRHHRTGDARRGALAAVPLIANGRPIGGLMLSFSQDRAFSPEDRMFIEIIAAICAQALERARLYDAAQSEIAERKHMLEQQKAFLRDVLLSVTEGKLHLCHAEYELPPAQTQVGNEVELSRDHGLDTLRHAALDSATSIGFSVERAQDLMTAVDEAGMNAIVHAGGGAGRICSNGNDVVQVWIMDQGKGIDVEDLPHATLMRGYSTAGTLGHGMKIMLQSIDDLWLMTNQKGTTVVLEQNKTAPPIDAVDTFPRGS